MKPLARKLLVLGACDVVVASPPVISFHAPAKPVLTGSVLALVLTLAQHFSAKR